MERTVVWRSAESNRMNVLHRIFFLSADTINCGLGGRFIRLDELGMKDLSGAAASSPLADSGALYAASYSAASRPREVKLLQGNEHIATTLT